MLEVDPKESLKNISTVGGILLIGCNILVDISSQYGAEIISRPSGLSLHITSSDDALYHAFNEINKKNSLPISFIFLKCILSFTDSHDFE